MQVFPTNHDFNINYGVVSLIPEIKKKVTPYFSLFPFSLLPIKTVQYTWNGLYMNPEVAKGYRWAYDAPSRELFYYLLNNNDTTPEQMRFRNGVNMFVLDYDKIAEKSGLPTIMSFSKAQRKGL